MAAATRTLQVDDDVPDPAWVNRVRSQQYQILQQKFAQKVDELKKGNITAEKAAALANELKEAEARLDVEVQNFIRHESSIAKWSQGAPDYEVFDERMIEEQRVLLDAITRSHRTVAGGGKSGQSSQSQKARSYASGDGSKKVYNPHPYEPFKPQVPLETPNNDYDELETDSEVPQSPPAPAQRPAPPPQQSAGIRQSPFLRPSSTSSASGSYYPTKLTPPVSPKSNSPATNGSTNAPKSKPKLWSPPPPLTTSNSQPPPAPRSSNSNYHPVNPPPPRPGTPGLSNTTEFPRPQNQYHPSFSSKGSSNKNGANSGSSASQQSLKESPSMEFFAMQQAQNQRFAGAAASLNGGGGGSRTSSLRSASGPVHTTTIPIMTNGTTNTNSNGISAGAGGPPNNFPHGTRSRASISNINASYVNTNARPIPPSVSSQSSAASSASSSGASFKPWLAVNGTTTSNGTSIYSTSPPRSNGFAASAYGGSRPSSTQTSPTKGVPSAGGAPRYSQTTSSGSSTASSTSTSSGRSFFTNGSSSSSTASAGTSHPHPHAKTPPQAPPSQSQSTRKPPPSSGGGGGGGGYHHTEDDYARARAAQEEFEARRLSSATSSISSAPGAKERIERAWREYEEKWVILNKLAAQTSNDRMIRWNDIPFPVLLPLPTSLTAARVNGNVVTPAMLTAPQISAFVLSPHHSIGKGKKDRIKAELLRWHPDRFEGRFLGKVPNSSIVKGGEGETEREMIRKAVGEVARVLSALLTATGVAAGSAASSVFGD